ncbi:preprotein translocase subunit SecG [Paenibacillus baekrokdamisoli]|nr:preprotein translocase subunit SecG [Paenibacillus baekrokdamisoli]
MHPMHALVIIFVIVIVIVIVIVFIAESFSRRSGGTKGSVRRG